MGYTLVNRRSQHRTRPVLIAIGAILLAWLLAWSGYVIARHSRMTAEKVMRFQSAMALGQLSPADRRQALQRFAEKLGALSPEERQKWRLDLDWFQQLTDEEKAFFIDAVMPGEMQMALKMFEKWPKARQQQEIDRALKDLHDHAANPARGALADRNRTNGPLFTPELDQKIRTMGLSTLYSKGSAETRAALAPLLMEVQRQFESGQLSLNNF